LLFPSSYSPRAHSCAMADLIMPAQPRVAGAMDKRSVLPADLIGNLGVEFGAPAQWKSRLSFEPPTYLEDQSTDEGSTDFGSTPGDISSAGTTPNTTPTEAAARRALHPCLKEQGAASYAFCDAAAWMQQAPEWPASSFEGFTAETLGAVATKPWATPSPWAAQGAHENVSFLSTGGGTSFLSTAPTSKAYPAALPRAPLLGTAPSVLGTAPLGRGGSWCTFMGGPAPEPVRAPVIFAAEELAPCGPNDAPLKVTIAPEDLEIEVVALDPRFPAKKRPPAW